MPPRYLACALVLVFAVVGNAHAGIVVTFGSSSISAGGSGYIPVFIHSDSGTIDLASTNFEFLISTTGATRLDFTDSLNPLSDPTFSDPSYVFSGMSGPSGVSYVYDSASYGALLGTAGMTAVPNDTFDGFDAADNGPDFYVSLGSSDLLLGMLPVTTVTPFAPSPGDTFTISLVSNPAVTFSYDSSGNQITYSSIAPDTVTIAGPSAVPEPGTFGMLLIGFAGLGWLKRQRA